MLNFDVSMFEGLSSIGVLGPEGRSFSYDNRASGYGRGEGAVCLVLKPLADAVREGDAIRAVIRGSRLNHDGKTPGIAQPNNLAQAELIKQAYTSIGLDVLGTDYVEGHGVRTSKSLNNKR